MQQEIFEQYVLSENKEDFISKLVPESIQLYFKALHAINTKETLTSNDTDVIQKLCKINPMNFTNGQYMHKLEFTQMLRVFDGKGSSEIQRADALKGLKEYLNLTFNATNYHSPYQVMQDNNLASDETGSKLESMLDEKIISFSNILSQAYTKLHVLREISPQYLCRLDVLKLISESKNSVEHTNILETFLSYTPCLHSIKYVPQLYLALHQAQKDKGLVYDFNQVCFDRLSITQLNEVGELLSDVVFSTTQFQLALVKKLFYKNIQNFIGKTTSNMTQEEKRLKRDELSVILIWAKENLPIRHAVLLRLLTQEIVLLNEQLNDYRLDSFIQFLNAPPSPTRIFVQSICEEAGKLGSFDASTWSSLLGLEQIYPAKQQSLIERYLLELLKDSSSTKDFDDFLEQKYLQQIFIKAKILGGHQTFIQQGSLLNQSDLENLLTSRSITILENNSRYVKTGQEVKLTVDVKNVQNLVVNIFEIKTESYYIAKQAPIDPQINLDGLIPILRTEYTYKEPANQVVRRVFDFKTIQDASRGYFIIDFFGDSISSRAVIQKGLISFVETPTIAGHLLTIVDEDTNICKPSKDVRTGVWIEGRFHSANSDGQLVIPYGNSGVHTQAIIVHGEFAEMKGLSITTESYLFKCSYLYNQESFLQGNKAKVIIHPDLTVNRAKASFDVIEDQLIKVSILNHQGIPTSIQFKDVKFDELLDTDIEIPIQSIVRSIVIECSGTIKKMDGSKQVVNDSKTITFELHEYPANQIFDIYLKNTDSLGYIVTALDKSGQAIPSVPIDFKFQMERWSSLVSVILQTDKQGRIILGRLENVESIKAVVSQFKEFPVIQKDWVISKPTLNELPSTIVITEGEVLEIPLPNGTILNRQNIAFCSKAQVDYQDIVYNDQYDSLKVKGAFLSIADLSEGSYILNLLEKKQSIQITVVKGRYWAYNSQYIVADNTFQFVEKWNQMMVTINETSLIPQTDSIADIIVTLNLPKSLTQQQRKKLRVHAFGYNFESLNSQTNLAQLRQNRVILTLNQVDLRSSPSSFFSNKKIGDEICYVYNRLNQQKRIGNTLEKPCVLLKRTFNRDTTFEQEKLSATQAYSASSMAEKQMRMPASRLCHDMMANCSMLSCGDSYGGRAPRAAGEIDMYLNFLQNSSFVSSNNSVGEDGTVLITGFEWRNYSSIQIIVLSDTISISDSFPTSADKTMTQDLRHQSAMKGDLLYTENLSSGSLKSGETLTISADSQTAVIGSIPEIFEIQKELMKTGRKSDSYLGKEYSTWAFLKDWNGLTDLAKLEKYNEFASHEINLFIFFKDKRFFSFAVLPFIRNKMQKTFIDYFLLNETKQSLKWASTERLDELNVLEKILLILVLSKNGLKQRAEVLAASIEKAEKILPKNSDLQKRLFLTIIESSAKDEVMAKANQFDEKDGMVLEQQAQFCGSLGMVPASQSLARYRGSKNNCLQREERKMVNLLDDSENEGHLFEGSISNTQLLQQREQFKSGYKKLEKTIEYVERQYYNDKNNQSYSQLVQINKFWSDVARHIVTHSSLANFVSKNFIFAFSNHVEALSVLSLMDLSFSARDNYDLNSLPGRKIQLLSKHNIVYFSKEIMESSEISRAANVGIIQTFFDPSDKFTTLKDDPSISVEKEIEEFLVNKIYSCKVIVTNISIANLSLSVLSEIPEGAIPVNSYEYTKSHDFEISSYQTYNNIEFSFYFPQPGTFSVYRSSASRNGTIVAQAAVIAPIVVKAVPEIKRLENLSDILNNGSKEDILAFAKTQNLRDETTFNIQKVLHIIQADKAFFLSFLEILREQGLFKKQVWEYSIHHNHEQGVLELFNNQTFRSSNLSRLHMKISSLETTHLSFDDFSVFEYHPLLTSRVHSFMDQNKSKILNVQFKSTYFSYIEYLAHVPKPNATQLLVLAYYLILQERIDEAITVFGKISSENVSSSADASKIQYDYFAAYLDIYTGGPNFVRARQISQSYLDYPIISWRNLFVNLSNQLAEYDGELLDEDERIDTADISKNLSRAEKEASVSMEISGKQVVVYYQNAETAELNFYQLDVEVLFSTQPFPQTGLRSDFSFIKPNQSIKLNFEKLQTREKLVINIPQTLENKNLHVQLIAASGVENLSYFSSSMKVQTIEKFGQVKVTDGKQAPLQKVYVKCFAKHNDDSIAFFRDGYTDLRGRFDYALSSSSDINNVKAFSILITSEEHGSLIKEAKPPSQLGSMGTTVSLLKKK